MNVVNRKLMVRCFELAEEARKRGDASIGSLLADAEGKIIAVASEQNRTKDLFAHAEILAIKQALKIRRSSDLNDCTLITTNEPCFLCSFAIRQTSISRVIFARKTIEVGGVSSKYPLLSANDIRSWKAPPEILFIQENIGQ